MYKKKVILQGQPFIKLQAEADKFLYSKVINDSGQYFDMTGCRYLITCEKDVICSSSEISLYSECLNTDEFIKKEKIFKITENSKNDIEVLKLKHSQKAQDDSIAMAEDAVNFLLMSSAPPMLSRMAMPVLMSLPQGTTLNEEPEEINTLGGYNMGNYLGNQIYKDKLKYDEVIAIYPQFKDDIDKFLADKVKADALEHDKLVVK